MDVYDEGGRFGREFNHCEGGSSRSGQQQSGLVYKASKALLVEVYIQISTEYLRHYHHTTSITNVQCRGGGIS
jgi:hypothetical protein